MVFFLLGQGRLRRPCPNGLTAGGLLMCDVFGEARVWLKDSSSPFEFEVRAMPHVMGSLGQGDGGRWWVSKARPILHL